MRVLFFNGRYPFCYYYRGYLPGIYSKQMIVSDFMRQDMQVDAIRVKQMCDQADVIVFQRPSDKKIYDIALKYRLNGKKIIFENDDTYSSIPLSKLENQRQIEIAKEMDDTLKKTLGIAHGAIASTDILAKEFSEINKNTVVLKNTISPRDYFRCKENTTGKFRVGLIGSVTTNDDYLHIKDDLKRIDSRGDITLVIMGIKYIDGTHLPVMQEDYDFWSSFKNIEWHPYCHVTAYMYQISRLALDLAIIPRKDHYFNYCKSNLKFLEMSLLKIPVLAQGFPNGLSPYETDRDYMTLIQDSWYDNIINIKNNYIDYKRLAEIANNYVMENYNIETYYKEWLNKIEKLCK